MKQTLIAMACAVALGLSAINADATTLTIGDDYYVGSINDSIPSSVANEAEYINYLITLDAGDGDIQIPVGTGEVYNREGSTLTDPLATALIDGALKVDTSDSTSIDVSGYTYILAKYDAHRAGGLVFLVSDLGTVDVPTAYKGKGLSHYTLFNSVDPAFDEVPDGGKTLALLGCALVGLGALRRKWSA